MYASPPDTWYSTLKERFVSPWVEVTNVLSAKDKVTGVNVTAPVAVPLAPKEGVRVIVLIGIVTLFLFFKSPEAETVTYYFVLFITSIGSCSLAALPSV